MKPPLNIYEKGATTFFACQYDQRFSYCLYVPADYKEDGSRTYPLIALIHGTERAAAGYRDAFADFAETHGCIVLAPLFPAGIIEPGELNNYKFIKFHDMRFDKIFLSMVDEVCARYYVDGQRILMHGFSGGGHFAHRFFYLHPERLRAVSIGAPGVVTLLDFDHDFWVGVRDFEAQFGKGINLEAMRGAAVQMVIGGEDTETWEITITPQDRLWMVGADLAGANRQHRMQSLKASFERHGIAVQHDIVAGVIHEGWGLLPAVRDFFARVLEGENHA